MQNELNPLVTVTRSSTGSLPAAGIHYYIAGHRAIRLEEKMNVGILTIIVQAKDSVLEFHFDATKQKAITQMEEMIFLMSQFDQAMETVQFISEKNQASTGSGSTSSFLCRGNTKVICPQGFFCNITDDILKSGVCKKAGKE